MRWWLFLWGHPKKCDPESQKFLKKKLPALSAGNFRLDIPKPHPVALPAQFQVTPLRSFISNQLGKRSPVRLCIPQRNKPKRKRGRGRAASGKYAGLQRRVHPTHHCEDFSKKQKQKKNSCFGKCEGLWMRWQNRHDTSEESQK